jgi:hypothetical protein
MPSGAHLKIKGDAGTNRVAFNQLINYSGDPTDYAGWEIVGFWLAPPAPEIPEYLPPDIERIYLQGERNFPVNGNEEAAGAMYRKALDIGLKKIDPHLTGTLGNKIRVLATTGKLTPDIVEWSEHVRDLGNEAVHEETPPSRKELEDLRGVTEMVLRYLFTLPNMIKKHRGEKLQWEP